MSPMDDRQLATKLDTLALLCRCAYPCCFEEKACVCVWKSNALLRRWSPLWMVVASIWRNSACVGYRSSWADDSEQLTYVRSARAREKACLKEWLHASEGWRAKAVRHRSIHRSAAQMEMDWLGRRHLSQPGYEITRATGVTTVFSLPWSRNHVPRRPRRLRLAARDPGGFPVVSAWRKAPRIISTRRQSDLFGSTRRGVSAPAEAGFWRGNLSGLVTPGGVPDVPRRLDSPLLSPHNSLLLRRRRSSVASTFLRRGPSALAPTLLLPSPSPSPSEPSSSSPLHRQGPFAGETWPPQLLKGPGSKIHSSSSRICLLSKLRKPVSIWYAPAQFGPLLYGSVV